MNFDCLHLYKTFATTDGSICALEDVNFSVADHEFVCIVGPSGCGKTTLLKIIAGLTDVTAGGVSFNNAGPHALPRSALVFQEHGLFPWMTVLGNVAFGLEMGGVPRHEREKLARAFINKVGLSPFESNYPHELSVGMRQRANIARAFVSDPDILLMDEPLGSLDAQTKLVLAEELLRIWKEHRKLVVYVTHDIREAILLGDRVLVMTGHPGRIREEIRVPLERPRDLASMDHPEVARLVHHIWGILEEEVRKLLPT